MQQELTDMLRSKSRCIQVVIEEEFLKSEVCSEACADDGGLRDRDSVVSLFL